MRLEVINFFANKLDAVLVKLALLGRTFIMFDILVECSETAFDLRYKNPSSLSIASAVRILWNLKLRFPT